MSCSLPAEIVDLIIDYLCNEPAALKACCVVSKSWIHRTRKHLFARVEFHTRKSPIELWKKTFPDPCNSPAHHTRILSIYGILAVTAADVGAGGWIRTFHNTVHLHLQYSCLNGFRSSLVPFHGLSPTLRSLRLSSTSSEVLDFICSFPFLEDLAWNPLSYGGGGRDTPSTSPKLTGFLDLNVSNKIRLAVRGLLGLPGGLHFTKITMKGFIEDTESITDLVSRCSDTLKSLDLSCYIPGERRVPPLDLSKATKLKYLSFLCGGSNAQRFATMLQTVKSENLRQITINPYCIHGELAKEMAQQGWQDLDRLLVQFWISHSIHPRIKCETGEQGDDLRALVPRLLPELTRAGLVDFVEY